MCDVDMFDIGQFPQLIKLDVILGAVQVNQVCEILKMVGVDFAEAFVGDVGRDDLLGVFDVEEFQ